MKEWNILAAAHRGQEKKALRFLNEHGEFKRSGFKDVLQGRVEDVDLFLERLESMHQEDLKRIDSLSRAVPLEQTFHFSLADFMEKLKGTFSHYVKRIENKKFYVRVKRRGHKGEISSQEIEKEISGFVLENLEKAGKQAYVSFTDADLIIVVETIGNWAGVTSITREMKEKYSFIKVK
jgi:tRNA(Ser,Leu) C12 N-acetylase TAN1